MEDYGLTIPSWLTITSSEIYTVQKHFILHLLLDPLVVAAAAYAQNHCVKGCDVSLLAINLALEDGGN